ncbi:MAG: FHA domain-containing protein [Deltaproteobacteria bacterium]|nr:MAG: FHA domain-containing protein [Deltaproteobacteria bacterium]
MASNDRPALSFEVYRGDTLLKTGEFREESVTIGSGSDALLAVDDPSLAELHAVFNIEDDGTVHILDLGVEGGVLKDGEKITNAEVRPGDAFTLGELRVVVRFEPTTFDDDEEATHVMTMPQELLAAAAAGEMVDDPTDPGSIDVASTDPGVGNAPTPAAPSEDRADETEVRTEDVLTFVLRGGSSSSAAGENRNRPKVLEVHQVWDNIVLDTKHYRSNSRSVNIGSKSGYRWSFIGIELAWVPAPLAMILPFTPPLWSEVSTRYKNDFYIPETALPSGDEYDLFVNKGGKHVARIAKNWGGFALIGDDKLSFDDLVAQGKAEKSGDGGLNIPLEDDMKLLIEANETIFVAQQTYPSRKVGAGFLTLMILTLIAEAFFLGILSLFAFIGMLFLLLVLFLPSPPETSFKDLDDRFIDMLLEKQEKREEKQDKKPQANPDAGEGAKAKREEGKVGKKDAKMEKAKGNKVEIQKAQLDKQIAEDAGVLGALRDGGMMDGFGGGVDAEMLGGIGGLIGAKGTQVGSGGLGSRGSGLGGGGSADGLGGLGTKGVGSGASGYGRGGGDFGAKGEGNIGAVGGDPIILGALDRALIDAVIKRHMNQIRYCYQRELTKNPSLQGKLVIKFVIAKDGSVSSANTKSTTLNTPTVENCVVSRFMNMQFPEPKGGGIVIVSYPFIFTAG